MACCHIILHSSSFPPRSPLLSFFAFDVLSHRYPIAIYSLSSFTMVFNLLSPFTRKNKAGQTAAAGVTGHKDKLVRPTLSHIRLQISFLILAQAVETIQVVSDASKQVLAGADVHVRMIFNTDGDMVRLQTSTTSDAAHSSHSTVRLRVPAH